MINNDVLRRLRYALDLNDPAMIEVFAQGGAVVKPDHLPGLLKKEGQEGFVQLDLELLDAFLDGLISSRRGKLERQPGRAAEPRVALTNNGILRKLRIALSFKEDDMIKLLKLADFEISRGELSAFFRQRGHKNFRPCGDQVVRKFLYGMALHLRGPKG
jgi:uncharacterized protein YehS (DUF1456 family)